MLSHCSGSDAVVHLTGLGKVRVPSLFHVLCSLFLIERNLYFECEGLLMIADYCRLVGLHDGQ